MIIKSAADRVKALPGDILSDLSSEESDNFESPLNTAINEQLESAKPILVEATSGSDSSPLTLFKDESPVKVSASLNATPTRKMEDRRKSEFIGNKIHVPVESVDCDMLSG